MEKAKSRPLATPKPLHGSSKNGMRDYHMDGSGMQNLVAIGLVVSASQ